MTEEEGKMERSMIAKMIEEKLEVVASLKSSLEHGKKTLGCSIDDQIVLTELEYRLVQEEMALLSLQEQHWQSAALWDAPHTPDIQTQVCEVLHSYIMSVQEKGSVPALYATEHPSIDNSILVSSSGHKPSVPVVEWAHQGTQLQTGDRLLEVNGYSVVGKDPNEVNHILCSDSSLCRVVFLRPVSVYQLLKSTGCKETSGLRRELTSVVSRLNHKMTENAHLKDVTQTLRNDLENLTMENEKLKGQLQSLQRVLVYFYSLLEEGETDGDEDIENSSLDESQNSQLSWKYCSMLTPTDIIDELINIETNSTPWLKLSDKTSDGDCSTEQQEHSATEDEDSRSMSCCSS